MSTGANGERRWRDSRVWFSYQLQDPQQQACTLQLTLFSGDAGRRFQVWFNGQLLREITIEQKPEAFYPLDLSTRHCHPRITGARLTASAEICRRAKLYCWRNLWHSGVKKRGRRRREESGFKLNGFKR